VAEILAAAPALRILVTSRVALRISGERELPVPPLDTGKGNWNASAVLPPAVELFVRQARAVRPDFMLNEANAHDVAAICARLDGLPLAIELAAARSRIFTPAALLERLERRLALLTGGPRDLAPRQQTLRAAIDWSYRLLDEQAQTLFARLGVFVGGWTLGAADAVAGDAESANSLSPNPRPRTLHPELLETLVTHSLVQVTDDPTGEPRFTFLETLREYALERLVERGEQELIRRRHAEYMLALAEEANAAIWGADQLAALDRLTLEHDNLRAALIWALEDSGDRMPGVRLAGALGWFWHFRGHWPEGRRWLARALAAQPAESDAQAAGWWAGYARALTMASGLAWAERDYTAAQAYADQALEAVQRCDDASIRGHAAGVRGLVALYVGESDAEPHFAESLAAFRRAEDEAGVALALLRLGLAAWSRQDLDSAEERLGRALALFRRLGAEWGTATTLASMGDVARARSDWAQVAQFYNEALQRYRRLRSNWYIASSLAALSGALGMLGNYEQAARLHGASAVLFEKIGMSLHDLDRVLYVAGQEAARVALGAERYAALHDRGRELPLDTILEQVGI
jgi:predicted ATPase